MLYALLKAALSGAIVMAASEVARRSATLGAIILSLPLVSILAFVWVWGESGDSARIADLSQGTFWYVLPTLPMFLVFPALLRHGVAFWPALGAACALTIVLYVAMTWALARFGVTL